MVEKMNKRGSRDWSQLSVSILSCIIEKIATIDDYCRFASVSTSWRAAIHEVSNNRRRSCSLLPLLLIAPPPPEVDTDDRHRTLYSLSRESSYRLCLLLPHDKACRGSSFGWLVTLETKSPHDFSVQLHNPFLDRVIHLPPLDNILQQHPDDIQGGWDGYYIHKAVLSADPSSSPDDFVVMAIMSRYHGLAFFKPGNATWTSIGNWESDWEQNRVFLDVIFFHKTNQFYAILDTGAVLAVSFPGGDRDPRLTQVVHPSSTHGGFPYLVEDVSSGGLYQVYKYHQDVPAHIKWIEDEDEDEEEDGEHYETSVATPAIINIRFTVFKLATIDGSWVKIDSLGKNIVFLGNNASLLRPTSDFPGCEPDCIYYTDDSRYRCCGFKSYGPPWDGIYSLEDDTTRAHYLSADSTKKLPQAIWVEPTVKL